MSFFKDSSGQEIKPTDTFVNSGLQPIIPTGTQLLCNIVSAKWEPATNYNNEHASIMLYVVEKGDYKDFTVKHKLQVLDNDPKKADKAINALMTYDHLCKGMLLAADKAKKPIIGDNELLARALNGGAVVATFDVYEMTGDDGSVRSGNWVRGIGPVPKAIKQEDKAIEEMSRKAQPLSDSEQREFDDEIPF